jgi:hypothetical protein
VRTFLCGGPRTYRTARGQRNGNALLVALAQTSRSVLTTASGCRILATNRASSTRVDERGNERRSTMTSDASGSALNWDAANCPECGAALDAEPIATRGDGLRVALVCPRHGAESILDPLAGE